MFKGVSKKIAEALIQREIIDAEMKEENIYALNAFFDVFLNVMTALLIGAALNMIFEIIVFIIVYRALRRYVGGSHSKTAIRCYISSSITYLTVLLAIKYYPLSASATTFLVVFCMIVIFMIAPVEADLKPLDDIEKAVFGRRGKISTAVCVFVYLILTYIEITPCINCYSVVTAVGIMTVTLFAAEGRIHQFFKK